MSHRISSIRNADHIIMLESGKIIEQGTHEELIGMNGNYVAIVNRQLVS